MPFPGLLGECLLELLYPERCAWCDARRGERPWLSPGSVVPGLRPWDRPHTCEECARSLAAGRSVRGETPAGMDVRAGLATSGDLVRAVGDWKYHGLRGLAWALAIPLVRAARFGIGSGPVVLAPIPLHRKRRRRRGFNQAEILARLAERAGGISVRTDLLRRRRGTGQQARLEGMEARRRNVAGAFVAAPAAAGVRGVWVVDDLVTSGATCEAAAASLHAAGAEVQGVLCVAVAPQLIRSRSG